MAHVEYQKAQAVRENHEIGNHKKLPVAGCPVCRFVAMPWTVDDVFRRWAKTLRDAKHDNKDCGGATAGCKPCGIDWIKQTAYGLIHDSETGLLESQIAYRDAIENVGGLTIPVTVADGMPEDVGIGESEIDPNADIAQAKAGAEAECPVSTFLPGQFAMAITQYRHDVKETKDSIDLFYKYHAGNFNPESWVTETRDEFDGQGKPDDESGGHFRQVWLDKRLRQSWQGALVSIVGDNRIPQGNIQDDSFYHPINHATTEFILGQDNPESADRRLLGLRPDNDGFYRGDADRLDLESLSAAESNNEYPQFVIPFSNGFSDNPGLYSGGTPNPAQFGQDFDNDIAHQYKRVVNAAYAKEYHATGTSELPRYGDNMPYKFGYPSIQMGASPASLAKQISIAIRAMRRNTARNNAYSIIADSISSECIRNHTSKGISIGYGNSPKMVITANGKLVQQTEGNKVIDIAVSQANLLLWLTDICNEYRKPKQASATQSVKQGWLKGQPGGLKRPPANWRMKPDGTWWEPAPMHKFTPISTKATPANGEVTYANIGEYDPTYNSVLVAKQFVFLDGQMVELRQFSENPDGWQSTYVLQYDPTPTPGGFTGNRLGGYRVNSWIPNNGKVLETNQPIGKPINYGNPLLYRRKPGTIVSLVGPDGKHYTPDGKLLPMRKARQPQTEPGWVRHPYIANNGTLIIPAPESRRQPKQLTIKPVGSDE